MLLEMSLVISTELKMIDPSFEQYTVIIVTKERFCWDVFVGGEQKVLKAMIDGPWG